MESRQKYFCRIAIGGNSYEMVTYMSREAIWQELHRAEADNDEAHLDTITPDGEHKISLDLRLAGLPTVMWMLFIPPPTEGRITVPRPRVM